MSRKYSYIDIAVSVTESGQSSSFFLTEGAPSVELPSLREIADHFTTLTEGYMMWNAPTRRAYSYFVIDNDVTPQAMLTVTVMVERDVLVSGRHLAGLLSSLKSSIMTGEDLDAESLNRMIASAGFVENPLRSSYDPWVLTDTRELCYRTYASPGELGNIIGFPRQPDYVGFGGVVVVPSSAQLVESDGLTQITTPVDKALMVVCPEGVEASAPCVNFSDHMTVTYRCAGFDPVSVKFEVGTTNRYVRISGPALIVNDSLHAGIIFRRRIPYIVKTPAGLSIDTHTVLINDRTATRTGDGFEVSNLDFIDGGVKVTISSTNFSTFTQCFDIDSLSSTEMLDVVLEPESKDILIRIDFGEGRVVEESLNIEKNTPEYCQLRAGRFHGFRAHRVMGATPEVYNIDLKHAAATLPVAAADEAEAMVHTTGDSAGDTPASKADTVVPPTQPARHPAEGPTAAKAPVFDNVSDTDMPVEADDDSPSSLWKRVARIVIAIVVLAVAVVGISKLYSSCSGSDAEVADATPVDSVTATADDEAVAGTTTGTMVTPSAPDNETEQEDVVYLNGNRTWRKASLRSEKYKALFEAIERGDVDAVVGNDYFAVEGRCTNRDALRSAEMMWNAKGTSQSKSHSRLMGRLTDNGSLDVHTLYEDLSRVMPNKSEYNKTPRPMRKQ